MATPKPKKTLEQDLNEKIVGLIKALQGSEDVAKRKRSFVGGGWFFKPTEFATDTAMYWTAFLALVQLHKEELKLLLPETAVASGMQMLYARFVMLWQSLPLPKDPKTLDEHLKETIDSEVATFAETVVKNEDLNDLKTEVEALKTAVSKLKPPRTRK